MDATTTQAAKEWGCSPDTVRRLIRAGVLPLLRRIKHALVPPGRNG